MGGVREGYKPRFEKGKAVGSGLLDGYARYLLRIATEDISKKTTGACS